MNINGLLLVKYFVEMGPGGAVVCDAVAAVEGEFYFGFCLKTRAITIVAAIDRTFAPPLINFSTRLGVTSGFLFFLSSFSILIDI